MQNKGSEMPKEHILVCLSSSPSNERIVRMAGKMAQAFCASLTALYVQTPGDADMNAEDTVRLQANMRLGQQLGAEIVTTHGEDVATQIAEYVRLSDVTKIVIGRSGVQRRHFWSESTLTEQLITLAPEVDIYIIPDVEAYKNCRRNQPLTIRPAFPTARELLLTIGILAVTTVIGWIFLRTMVLNMYDNLGISNVNNYLNIRVEPKEDAKIIGKMTSKSGGEILETTEDGGWYKIKSGPVTGYVKSEFILTGDAAKQEALQVAQLMAIVSTDRLNARTEPNTDAPIWTQISNSERYSVMSQQDGWVQIALDETSAYVATEFVDVRYALNEAIEFTPVEETPEPETKAASSKGGSGSKSSSNGGSGSQKASSSGSSKRAQIANYATQFLGNPYVWGGTSLTNGTDCSGFTMSVMAHFGVGLPHHSGSQAGAGRSISSSQMRPGDLIFYTNSGGTINHVALYIGGGRVCHASNARDGIKISTWNYRSPVAIRNVLGD